MPSLSVPVIQDSATLDTSTGRQRVNADPSAFGAAEARATGAVAESVGRIAAVAEDKADELDEAEALELDNQLSRRIRERMYNTDDGYLATQRGRAALDTRGQVETDLDAIAAEVGATARNERSRQLFGSVANRRLQSAYGDIAGYAADQSRVYQNEQSEGRISEAVDNAVAAYGDPAVVSANINTALGELERVRVREGWSPETFEARRRRVQSDVMQRVIVQLVATDPEAAQEMYARVRPELSAQEAGELLTTMRAAERERDDNTIDEAWAFVAAGQRIPPDLWARVPGRSRIDIQNEIRRRAEGGSGGGDRARVNDLAIMAVADPEAFARLDLRAERGRLGESAYGSLGVAQARIRNGEPRQGISREMAQGAMAMAERQLRAAGLELGADADEEDQARVADFQGDLIGLLDRFAETNGQMPNAQEQLSTIQNLLAERQWAGGNDGRRRQFETYTPLAQIPPEDRARIEARLRAGGMPVTRANIERYYELQQIDAVRGVR